MTRPCRPVERALVDLWHADERGKYDNGGYRYRGHVFTNTEGRYHFRTVLPALYPGRTRHIVNGDGHPHLPHARPDPAPSVPPALGAFCNHLCRKNSINRLFFRIIR
jgi:hypothetical protein